MINRSILVGRLTKDPELHKTQGSNSVVSFTLAVERQFKNQATGKRDADFINCVAWNKTAEILYQYTHKGSLIGTDGRIQTRSYNDKNGQRVFITEVVVENISFLGGDNQSGVNGRSQSPRGYNNAHRTSSVGNATQDPFTSTGEISVSDDDLPF